MDDIKARRLLILESYKIIEKEGFSVIISMWELGESIGLDKKQTRRNIEYLVEKGFFKWMSIGGGISPTIKIDDMVNDLEKFDKLFPAIKKNDTELSVPLHRYPKKITSYKASTDPFITIKNLFLREVEGRLCFVLMPFAKEQTEIYRSIIKPTVEKHGYTCIRADDIYQSTHIMNDILGHIKNGSIIIADLTGRNPNVFYELGIAHTIKYPERVILLTRSSDEDVPFDLQSIRSIKYNSTDEGIKKLENKLEKFLSFLDKLRITNITNKNDAFYITVRNSTEYHLVNDDGNNRFDILHDSKQSEVQTIIKDNLGNLIADYIVNDYNNETAKFTNGKGISRGKEGEIEISVPKINPGITYTIILIAGITATTEKYTAL